MPSPAGVNAALTPLTVTAVTTTSSNASTLPFSVTTSLLSAIKSLVAPLMSCFTCVSSMNLATPGLAVLSSPVLINRAGAWSLCITAISP